MASIFSNRFFYNRLVAMEGDTIKAALLKDTYTPDKDHNLFSDVSAYEISGSGYTAGGKTLVNLSASQDDTNDRANLDCDDLEWTTITLTDARYLVLYNVSNSNNIEATYEFSENQIILNGTFQVRINILGLLSLTQS